MTGRRLILHRVVFLIFAAAVFGGWTSARADDSLAQTRAARLTYFQGAVTVSQADNTASVPAQLNLPLLAGVQLATGEDGQAEVEFEDGSVVRLTPNSVLSLDSLTVETDGIFTTGLSLLHGLAYFELRATPQYRYTVDAGSDTLSPVENTTVRVNFDEPPAIFAVLDGTAHIERRSSPSNAATAYQTDVRAGESLRGDSADPSRYFLTQDIAEESWDQWNEDLDQSATAQAAEHTAVRDNYAGAQGYGWSDLDANGSWYDVPGQGPLWQPQVAADNSAFDPYGNGAWVSYPGTGYLWASSYSWGWTPYRCGNWSYFNGFGWGWAPGGGCGGFGWGFASGGVPVNIGIVPRGYQPIRVPIPGHGPQRPWLPVHTTIVEQRPVRSGSFQAVPRHIDGIAVMPIRRMGGGDSGDRNIGSSLQRDYPIDSATRAPVLGLASTRPAVLHTNTGWRAAGAHPASEERPATSDRPITAPPSYSGQSYPARIARPAPAGQVQRPVQQNGTGQRGSPTPSSEPVQRNSPAPSSVPVQRSSPPPPAPSPVQRSSPPPSSPAPAPSHPTNSPGPASSPGRPIPR